MEVTKVYDKVELTATAHSLIKDHEGTPIYDEAGNCMIWDSQENKVICVAPSHELFQFFGILEPEEEITQAPDSNNQTRTDAQPEATEDSSNDTDNSVSCENHKWDREDTLHLFESYKKHEKLFKSKMKNEAVWKVIKEDIPKFPYSASQCETRFKYLKSRYMKKKDNMGTRGTGQSPIMFTYLKEMDELFGNKPNVTPIAVASSSRKATENNEEEKNQEVAAAKPTRLQKQITSLVETVATQEQKAEENRERRHQERQEMNKSAIDAYKTLMQKLIDKL